MFGKFKNWHSGLSKAGKGIVWTIAGVFGIAAVGAAANPAPALVETKPAAQVQKVEKAEKELFIETKTVTETSSIAFTSSTVQDVNLEKGKTVVKTVGVNGVKTLTYEVKIEDGKEKNKKLLKEEVTTAPVNQITAVGTYEKPAQASNCDPNYTPCVPNVSYDLDCKDIGFRVTVIGNDHHGFDGNDNDGLGCESY